MQSNGLVLCANTNIMILVQNALLKKAMMSLPSLLCEVDKMDLHKWESPASNPQQSNLIQNCPSLMIFFTYGQYMSI